MTPPKVLSVAAVCLCLGASATMAQTVLLNPGAEPRRELRYSFVDGYSEQGSMDMRIGVSMSMAGIAIPQLGLPTIRMNMTMRTVDVGDDGSARFEFQYDSAEAVGDGSGAAGLGAALAPALSQLGGISGWVRVDPRGATLESGLIGAGSIDPQLSQVLDNTQQSLQQMSAPFPVDPVGVGAQWQATSNVESGEFTLSQTATYTLEAFDSDHVTLDVSLTQTAPRQIIAVPGLPPEAAASLESLESTGTGTMRIDLASLIPTSQLSTSMAMAMSLALQGQAQQISMNVQTDLSMAPTGATR